MQQQDRPEPGVGVDNDQSRTTVACDTKSRHVASSDVRAFFGCRAELGLTSRDGNEMNLDIVAHATPRIGAGHGALDQLATIQSLVTDAWSGELHC